MDVCIPNSTSSSSPSAAPEQQQYSEQCLDAAEIFMSLGCPQTPQNSPDKPVASGARGGSGGDEVTASLNRSAPLLDTMYDSIRTPYPDPAAGSDDTPRRCRRRHKAGTDFMWHRTRPRAHFQCRTMMFCTDGPGLPGGGVSIIRRRHRSRFVDGLDLNSLRLEKMTAPAFDTAPVAGLVTPSEVEVVAANMNSLKVDD